MAHIGDTNFNRGRSLDRFGSKRDRRLEQEQLDIQTNRENRDLGGILNQDFRPEFDRLQGEQGGLDQRFLDFLESDIDFEGFRGQLSALAESVTGELFGAGGQVEQLRQQARGNTVVSGFGTGSGGLTNATQNIFSGARDQVAQVVGQGAIQLSGQAVQKRSSDLSNLFGFTQNQGSRLDDIRDSLFGGQASIEQLRLADQQLNDNRRLIDRELEDTGGGFGGFLGAVGGGLLGSFLGPVGPAAGSKLGGRLFGG